MTIGIVALSAIGIAVGSFLNVVAMRYNTGMSFSRGRSHCFSCGRKLRWYELIPVVSYIAIGGRCRTCKSRISPQYLAVEIITGVLFVSLYIRLLDIGISAASLFETLVALLIFSILICIVIYDARHKIIPDAFVYLFIGLSLLYLGILTYFTQSSLEQFAAHFAGGPAVALPLFLLWLFSKGAWIGFGDIKLALGMGWFLGPLYGFSALILAFWVGAIFGVAVMAYERFMWMYPYLSQRSRIILSNALKTGSDQESYSLPDRPMLFTMKSEVPFGPFLIIGTATAYFLQLDVIGFSYFLS
jgi:leader peptidase (prepilin peptidase) / N-methyltransferase